MHPRALTYALKRSSTTHSTLTPGMKSSTLGVAIATPHGLATDAGAEAISAGGNAIDAALAAAAVLTVVYPHQCSLGGDLTALVRHPTGKVEAVLSIGAAPMGIDTARLRATSPAMPQQGPYTITVPGVVAGWSALSRLGARFGLQASLTRAAGLAADGTPVASGLARAIHGEARAIAADPGLRGIFAPRDELLAEGETMVQPALAATLRTLAHDPDSFYNGALAERVAAGLASLGSPLGAQDLAAHTAERSAPLTAEWYGVRWWAAPPPSQGASALALIDPSAPGDLLTRAQNAFAARDKLLGDPRGGPIDLDGLRWPRSTDTGPIPAAAGDASCGDTVAVTAVDAEGYSVALIQSVYHSFGAGLLEPDTGIVLHNRGAAFALLRDAGAHAVHPARLAPGHRPPHTLCPLLAESCDVRLSLGCQGSRAQPLILGQVARALTDPKADLDATLAAPRWVTGGSDLGLGSAGILAEPGAAVPPTRGLPLIIGTDHEDRCGHVQAARAIGQLLEASADPRADGQAVAIASAGCSSGPDH